MIRISTRGRYALRMTVDLALNGDAGPVSRQNIARRQGISADYVAQLFRKLREAGLVLGIRGPGGGYALGREPAAITAGDVLRAVEGPVAVVPCVGPGSDAACDRSGHCVTQKVWDRLSVTMRDYLDSVTVAELRDQARELIADQPEPPA